MHDKYQSAYRQNHSTETALVRIKSDIMDAVDQGKIVILILLDQSSAFDIMSHRILLERMSELYGIQGKVLDWFHSYVSQRKQVVMIDGESSEEYILSNGVPQGSVLGPKLFSMYTRPLGDLIADHGFHYHLYADDAQVYMSCSANVTSCDLNLNIKGLMQAVSEWMVKSQLKLNSIKTDIIAFSSKQNYESVKNLSIVIHVDDVVVPVKTDVRDLGVYFDTCLTMENHVNHVTRQCFMHLRNIAKVRQFLTCDALQSLIRAMVTSRLDYGNALLCGIFERLTTGLQRVQNYAARLIAGASRGDHITPLLVSLHWLPIKFRISYKVLVLVYQAIHGTAPVYMCELLQIYQPSRSLRSESELRLVVPRFRTVTYGANSFRTTAAKLWNSLPVSLRNLPSFNSFKSMLKTHLFQLAYPS